MRKPPHKTLREHGFRLTPQRRLILAALRHAGGHSSAQEIRDAVQAAYPDVDASTVYRTLTALRDAGLVSEDGPGRRRRPPSSGWRPSAITT